MNQFSTKSKEYEIIFTSNSTHGIKLGIEILSLTSTDLIVLTKDNHTSMAGIRRKARSSGSSVLVYDGTEFIGDTPGLVKRIIICWPKQSNFNGLIYSDTYAKELYKRITDRFDCDDAALVEFNGK